MIGGIAGLMVCHWLVVSLGICIGRLSPDVWQGEGVSAKKGKREGLREKNRGRRVSIFVGEAVSVNGLGVSELVPSLKETFEIRSSQLLCFLRKIQWCHQW